MPIESDHCSLFQPNSANGAAELKEPVTYTQPVGGIDGSEAFEVHILAVGETLPDGASLACSSCLTDGGKTHIKAAPDCPSREVIEIHLKARAEKARLEKVQVAAE
jgi:hypothetical protein